MERDACLLVNPVAGGGRAGRAAPQVERALRDRGVVVRSETTRDLTHGREVAVAAARSGEAVLVLSGDGLVGAVADELRHIDGSLLGVLPGGRGNDFARVLGIPLDPVAACEVIVTGEEKPIDLGEVEGRAFVGIASVGFDSEANRIANEAPSRLGGLVYAYGALRALAAWRPARFEIDVDGKRVQFSGYSVAGANSKAYGGGMYAAPDAELDDGLLDVPWMEDVSKLRFVTRILPKVFKGTHVSESCIHVLRGAELRISADRPFDIYADGDPIGTLPVTVRALRGAIKVLVPASTSSR